jgi:hypothetical protein
MDQKRKAGNGQSQYHDCQEKDPCRYQSISPTTTHEMTVLKNIYRGPEFKYYNELMNLRAGLIEDFLKLHPNFENLDFPAGLPPQTPGAMKVSILKYQLSKEPTAYTSLSATTEKFGFTGQDYPTAWQGIILRFPECNLAGYSVMAPHSIIKRHYDYENESGNLVRVHIPLIVPQGDLGMEVEGETVDWSDLFVFSNQKIHSAWNFTDHTRLVFIADLPRSICDIPMGQPLDDKKYVAPFSKTISEAL